MIERIAAPRHTQEETEEILWRSYLAPDQCHEVFLHPKDSYYYLERRVQDQRRFLGDDKEMGGQREDTNTRGKDTYGTLEYSIAHRNGEWQDCRRDVYRRGPDRRAPLPIKEKA